MQIVYNKPLSESEGTTEGMLVAVGMVCFGQVSKELILFPALCGGTACCLAWAVGHNDRGCGCSLVSRTDPGQMVRCSCCW